MRIVTVQLLVLCLVGCGGSSGSDAQEPTVVVTTLADAGAGSLRDALGNAVPGDRIGFEPGLAGALTLTSPLSISSDVTIDGGVNDPIHITATGSALFDIEEGANVVLSNLTIRDVTDPPMQLISNHGTLVMNHVTVRDCDILNNVVRNRGTLYMRDCKVSGCTGHNGAVVRADNATTTIERCAFFGNEADASGGAIRQAGGVMHIVNTTLHNNEAHAVAPMTGVGGAIASTDSPQDPNPVLIIVHSTITANVGDFIGAGVYVNFDGGGGHVEIRGSIVAQNLSPSDPDVAIVAALVNTAHNVIGTGDGAYFFDGVSGNEVGTAVSPLDPLLGALSSAGGTMLRTPMAASPAADLVPFGACLDASGEVLALDQRRAARFGVACDAGSAER